MKEDWWLELKAFKESGKQQDIVSFKLPKKDRDLLNEFPQWQDVTIQCRLLKIVLES